MKLIKLLSACIFILAVCNIAYTSKLVDYGERISNLEEEIQTIEHENQKLNLSITKQGSITTIADKIQESGFEKNSNIVTLKLDKFVALSQ